MAKRKNDKFLNNNENLPITQPNLEWTTAMLEEYKKCKEDVIYFAENYFYIIVLDAEPPRQKIQLYDAQKDAIKKIVKNRRTIICASRQVGKTTLLTVVCLWYALFKTDYNVAILANKEDQAKEILERIKMAYEEIPNWLKSGVFDFTKEQLKLTNGSKIFVSTTSQDAIRGKSVNLLFIDEFAHVRKEIADPFFKSIIPTLSSSKKSKLVLVSTPQGRDNKFYEIFSEAEKGTDKEGWAFCRIHWSEIPGRDEEWKLEQLRAINYDMNTWNQEFELMFLDSGSSSINANLIEKLKQRCIPALITLDDGNYEIWKEPEKGHIYVFGIDTAEGVGKDYSVCQIIDITDPQDIQQVAKYSTNRMLPSIFAEKLANIIPAWGRPFICVESNKEGGIVLNDFINSHNIQNIVTYNMENDKKGYYQKPGIFCHTNSKTKGVTNLRYWVESLQVVTIPDIKTVKEFETFVRKDNNKWGALPGTTDDHYMALVWALILLEKNIAARYLDIRETDETGSPLRIRDLNEDLALQAFDEGNKSLSDQVNYNDPMPYALGMRGGRSSYASDDMESLLASGWRLA